MRLDFNALKRNQIQQEKCNKSDNKKNQKCCNKQRKSLLLFAVQVPENRTTKN